MQTDEINTSWHSASHHYSKSPRGQQAIERLKSRLSLKETIARSLLMKAFQGDDICRAIISGCEIQADWCEEIRIYYWRG